jgi:hypothetical protein
VWCEDVIEFPVSMRNAGMLREKNEDDSPWVSDKDGVRLNVDVSFSFTIDAKRAPQIYETHRTDIDTISAKYMRRIVINSVQTVFAEYTADSLTPISAESLRRRSRS